MRELLGHPESLAHYNVAGNSKRECFKKLQGLGNQQRRNLIRG